MIDPERTTHARSVARATSSSGAPDPPDQQSLKRPSREIAHLTSELQRTLDSLESHPNGGLVGGPNTEPLRLLYVCTANLCRSITAEELTRRSLAEQPKAWVVRSAGLDVDSRARLPSRVQRAMERLGIPTDVEPRQFDGELALEADLILTAERSHRARIVRNFAGTQRKTYTIQQFARFCAAARNIDDPGFLLAAADMNRLAATGRTGVQPVTPDQDDITDPVRSGTAQAMYACAELLRTSIVQITGSRIA